MSNLYNKKLYESVKRKFNNDELSFISSSDVLDIEAAEEEMRRAEIKKEQDRKIRQRKMEDIENLRKLEEERKEREETMEKEADYFFKCLLRLMEDLTYDEIRITVSKMFYNSQRPEIFDRVINIYRSISRVSYDYTDCGFVVNKALTKLMEHVSREDALSHKEFPYIEPAKTFRR